MFGRRDKSASQALSVWMKEHLLLKCSTILYEFIVASVIGLAGMGAWTERNQRLFVQVEAQVGEVEGSTLLSRSLSEREVEESHQRDIGIKEKLFDKEKPVFVDRRKTRKSLIKFKVKRMFMGISFLIW